MLKGLLEGLNITEPYTMYPGDCFTEEVFKL